MFEEFLSELMSGKSGIISLSVNTLLKVTFIVMRELLNRGLYIVVVDEKGYLAHFMPTDLLDKVRLVERIDEACSEVVDVLIVFLPRNPYIVKTCRARNVIVLSRSLRPLDRLGFTRFYLKKLLENGEIEVRCYDKGSKFRIKISNRKPLVYTRPTGILGKAYDVLEEALSSYGEISIKDALLILSRELDIDKKHARRVLVTLSRRGYIKITKGKLLFF